MVALRVRRGGFTGDMGQRLLRVDVFTSHGGRPKERGKKGLTRLKLCHIYIVTGCHWGHGVASLAMSEGKDSL